MRSKIKYIPSMVIIPFTILVFMFMSGCGDNWFADQNDDHSIRYDNSDSSGFPYVRSSWRPATIEAWMEIYMELDEPRGYTAEEWNWHFDHLPN